MAFVTGKPQTGSGGWGLREKQIFPDEGEGHCFKEGNGLKLDSGLGYTTLDFYFLKITELVLPLLH